MQKPTQQSTTRGRGIVTASTKGGSSKSTLTGLMAYEATRFGLNVLCVDVDGGAGLSSMIGAYPAVDQPSISEVIKQEAPIGNAIVRINDWCPDASVPWVNGGPAVEVPGSLFILPAAQATEQRETVSSVVSDSGTTKETRLATALSDPAIHNFFDLIFIDMPGTDHPAVFSAVLHSAQHVIYPALPSMFAFEAICGADSRIDSWIEASGKSVNHVGLVPVMFGYNRGENKAVEAMEAYIDWVNTVSGGTVDVLAPGVQRRNLVETAAVESQPLAALVTTKLSERDAGTIPPAVTHMFLTILENISRDPEDADTDEWIDIDVEALRAEVLKHDMPQRWRDILTGPKYIKPGQALEVSRA